MKLIRASKDQFQFHLGQREKRLFVEVLRLYPRIPSAHQPLTKSSALPDAAASQKLLDEALAEQRAENRKRLDALLADPQRLSEQEHGWRLSLTPAEIEWLLQVLNDVNVGSWVILGSPEKPYSALNAKTAPHLWAMQAAAAFTAAFVSAVDGGGAI